MSTPEEHRLDAKPPPLNRWARLLFIDESSASMNIMVDEVF